MDLELWHSVSWNLRVLEIEHCRKRSIDLGVQLIEVHHFTDEETKAFGDFGGSCPGSQEPRHLCLFLNSPSKTKTHLYLLFLHLYPLEIPTLKSSIDLYLVLQSAPSSYVFLYSQLKEKYGPVFTVYMGPRPVVVLCGHEAVKEALVDRADEFSGRGELASIERNFQGHGK